MKKLIAALLISAFSAGTAVAQTTPCNEGRGQCLTNRQVDYLLTAAAELPKLRRDYRTATTAASRATIAFEKQVKVNEELLEIVKAQTSVWRNPFLWASIGLVVGGATVGLAVSLSD